MDERLNWKRQKKPQKPHFLVMMFGNIDEPKQIAPAALFLYSIKDQKYYGKCLVFITEVKCKGNIQII